MDIDARRPRFGAAVTTAVLAVALVTQNPRVLGRQALAFAAGAAAGVPRSPYGFRTAVRRRLDPPPHVRSRTRRGLGLSGNPQAEQT